MMREPARLLVGIGQGQVRSHVKSQTPEDDFRERAVDIQRVHIVGAGAIGSVLAGKLARSEGLDVTLVGSSEHWRAVRGSGLILHEGTRSDPCVRLKTEGLDSISPVGESDRVILACKLTGLERIASFLRDRVSPRAPLLAIQNGLGVDDLVAALFGRIPERALLHFGALVEEPGRVRYFPGRIRVRASAEGREFARLLGEHIPCEIETDFRAAEWAKLAINCLANPLAGILRVPNGPLADHTLDPLKGALLAELKAVAAAEGIALETSVEEFNAYISGPTGGNTPSMAVDLARRSPTEIEFLNGAVERLGRKHGVATPVNAAIASAIRFLSARSSAVDRAS